MPSTRVLLIALIAGTALFVLAAFTLIGLVGELVAALALIGLGLRAACDLAARLRSVDRC